MYRRFDGWEVLREHVERGIEKAAAERGMTPEEVVAEQRVKEAHKRGLTADEAYELLSAEPEFAPDDDPRPPRLRVEGTPMTMAGGDTLSAFLRAGRRIDREANPHGGRRNSSSSPVGELEVGHNTRAKWRKPGEAEEEGQGVLFTDPKPTRVHAASRTRSEARMTPKQREAEVKRWMASPRRRRPLEPGEKRCRHCGEPYRPTHGRQAYCQPRCAKRASDARRRAA